MENLLNVRIPKDAKYTLYAEGVFMGIEDFGIEYQVTLDFSYPVVLYYTFKKHRRIYIIMKPSGTEVFRNDDLSETFSIIAQLRGRPLDRFKRSLRYIVKKTRSHKFSVEFYFKLAFLCQQGENDRLNLNKLLRKNYEG